MGRADSQTRFILPSPFSSSLDFLNSICHESAIEKSTVMSIQQQQQFINVYQTYTTIFIKINEVASEKAMANAIIILSSPASPPVIGSQTP